MYNYLKLFMLLTLITAYSCDPDDPDPVNEEEVITTVTYTLTPQGGGTPVVLSFKDLDGDGGSAPVITGGLLANNTTYNGVLTFSDESKTPTKDITSEIKTEGTEHQVFFAITELLADAFDLAYTDADSDGNPIGLTTTFKTKKIASGELQITLRHEPNKKASGVSNGEITNAGGETDVEVIIPLVIK
jgi:hypothetical protein